MSGNDELAEPLQVLEDAVRTYLATSTDQASVLVAGVLCYEAARYDDDGDLISAIEYVGLTDSMAASAGVVHVAGLKLARDLGAYQLDGEDDDLP